MAAGTGGKPQTCIIPAKQTGGEAADGADGEVHLAHNDDDHLR